jgi:hypothetical protein
MAKKEGEKISLDLSNRSILIQNLLVKNEDVFSYLEDKKDREELVRKAIVLGIVGLKSMGAETRVDYIDKRFTQFMAEVERRFSGFEDKVEAAFDSKNPESPVGRLYRKIEDTFDDTNTRSPMFRLAKQLEEYFNDDHGVVRNIISNTFDVSRRDSPIGRFMGEIDVYFNKDSGVLKELIEKNFDTSDPESPMGLLVNNIDNYFSEEGVIKKMLNEHFDMNNTRSTLFRFSQELENNFDVDKGTIKVILDPNRPGSPVNLLKEEMIKNFNEVRDRLSTVRAEQAIIDKSTQKGGLFEDVLYDQLQDITNAYGDWVESVGTITGATGKTGDFLITLRGSDERIVVEAKDSLGYTIPRTVGEIEDALENRRAKFCIFVFKSLDQMPRALHPCRIGRNYIITTAEANGLYYSYHVAKTVVESELSKNAADSIPIEKIQSELAFLIEKTLTIEEVLKKTKLITSNVEAIDTMLKALHLDMEEGLKRIIRLLA